MAHRLHLCRPTYSRMPLVHSVAGIDTQRSWFQFCWHDEWVDMNIGTKGMVPVVVATALWGASWENRHVRFHSE